MTVLHLGELIARHREGSRPYLEFLRRDSMSVGLYVLPADGTDVQQPHDEDEVYVVLAGRATISVAGADHPVRVGSVVFVERNVEHRFHSIEEALQVLVFFAPAET